MDWRFFTSVLVSGRDQIRLAVPQATCYLAVINCPTAKTSWNKAGTAKLTTSDQGIEFFGSGVTVGFRNGAVLTGIPIPLKLQFSPVPWLPPSTLSVWYWSQEIVVYTP